MLWRWLDYNDFFYTDYHDLTPTQAAIFEWQSGDNDTMIIRRYEQHFADPGLTFPRQPVAKVKFFKNYLLFGGIGRSLKRTEVPRFIKFCNSPANFTWSETTWTTTESECYCNLYNSDDKVVGKMYFCLNGCFMTDARPFCPSMKFGMLSTTGFLEIKTLFKDGKNWE